MDEEKIINLYKKMKKERYKVPYNYAWIDEEDIKQEMILKMIEGGKDPEIYFRKFVYIDVLRTVCGIRHKNNSDSYLQERDVIIPIQKDNSEYQLNSLEIPVDIVNDLEAGIDLKAYIEKNLLTSKEAELFGYIYEGYSDVEISKWFFLTPSRISQIRNKLFETIRDHMENKKVISSKVKYKVNSIELIQEPWITDTEKSILFWYDQGYNFTAIGNNFKMSEAQVEVAIYSVINRARDRRPDLVFPDS